MNRSSLPVSVNTMKKWFESDDKVLQCTLPFQRHSGMWSPILKSNLVWSMLADSYKSNDTQDYQAIHRHAL